MTSVGVMASGVSAGTCTDVLAEPFDNLSAWSVSGGTTIVASGRTGSAMQVTSSSGSVSYNIPSADQSASITIGFAVRTDNLGSDVLFVRSDAGATDHNRINIAPTGAVIFSRGTLGIASSATGLITTNTWYYLEVQCTLADSGGTAIVRLNGTEIINATGLDTKNAGTKTVYDQIRFSTPDGRIYLYDDLYLSTGSACAFKGDTAVAGFATFATANTETGTSLGASNAIPSPTGVVVGNLLVANVSNDGGGTVLTASTGWTEVVQVFENGASPHRLATFARIADGGANDTLSVSGATDDYCASILRITRHGVTAIATDIKVASTFDTAANVADPPSLDAGTSRKWLWVAVAALDQNTGGQILGAPSGYTSAHSNLTAGTVGSGLGVAYKQNEVQTENPGVWGTSAARPYMVATLAIPPAGVPNAPTIIGSSLVQQGSTAARVITPHASTVNGDLLLVVGSNVGSSATMDTPAGWTVVQAFTVTGSLGSATWARVRTAGDTTYSFTITGTGSATTYVCLTLRGWSGVLGDLVIGTTGTRASSGGTTVTTAPSITTVGTNSLVLCIATERTTATETGITSVDNGFSEYLWVGHGAGGIETVWIGTKSISGTVAVGATSVTYPNTQAANAAAFQLGVRP